MKYTFADKRVLITGVCGTVGAELLKQVAAQGAKEIIGLDNNESALFFISEAYKGQSNVNFYMCDIRRKERLRPLFNGVEIILHSAALKHVILNEQAPTEAIYTNIIGTQNIVDVALECGVERVVFTSSDKAVNPTNVMGTSKLMGERLMTAANASKRSNVPIFASTRFGNVLGSNGSVIPLFKKQILAGGPVTLTDEGMSRFVMTLEEAARLVMESVFLAKGGEVFVTKMPIIEIKDLVVAMIDILKEKHNIEQDIEINIIGAKPGEKLYEELISEEEIRRTVEIENYFAVLPAFEGAHGTVKYDFDGKDKPADRIYRSDLEESMSIDELKDFLLENNLL
ncbi:polysaccharide biosynthesis protein [bacterium]|nr:polysaccharide biosynthesis protein [bacterium]